MANTNTHPVKLAIPILLMLFISINDCRAQDTKQLFYNLSENLGQYTFVGDVGIDSDIKNDVPANEVAKLEFQILIKAKDFAENTLDYFIIDTNTGVLRTSQEIDRDVICMHLVECPLVITVLVSSQITGNNFNQFIKVTINITDINDNPPTFDPKTVSKSIPENTAVGSSVSILAATDPDSPNFGISDYAITTGVPEFSLKEVNTDGSVALYLVVNRTLNREATDFYRITVTAKDRGAQTGTLNVDIDILDINDNQPIFKPPQYNTNIDENFEPGKVVTTVLAEDKDLGINAEIVYSFDAKTQTDFGDMFSIKNTTGDISLSMELNYEAKKVYNLVVTAKEAHHETIPAEAQVVINVNDINDNAPIITTSSLSPTGNVEVLENDPLGTFIAHLQVADPDTGRGGQFSCKLQENVDNHFRLESINADSSEFKISTNFVFNREDNDQHTFKFQCTDQGVPQMTSTEEIRVTILDQNDNAPKFTNQIYKVEVSENNEKGLFLTQVKANDPDFGINGQVEYSLYTEAMTYIHVDAISGNITAKEVFDYEKYHSLSFGIIAKDKGIDSHQTTAILSIKIINENDEPPQFTTTHFQFRVNETRPSLTNIGQLTIKERDPILNNVTFAFRENSLNGDLFSIDPYTGEIFTKRSFDADDSSAHFFEFEVKVMDSVYTHLHSGAVVSVTVLDLNDNRPELLLPNIVNNTVSVASDFPKGQLVTTVDATDKDSGINADISFMIESGNDGQYFTLSENGGELRTMRSLEHIKERIFVLSISASDKGRPPLAIEDKIKIIVNSSLSAVRNDPSTSTAGSDNLTIVIVVAVISAILIVILILSIVILQRKDKFLFKQKQRRMSKLLYDQKASIVQQQQNGGINAAVDKVSSFSSIDKAPVQRDLGYSNEGIDTHDEYPIDFQIGYPHDQRSRLPSYHKDEEADSQLSDQSGADSGRGSNDDPDLNASHMSIPQPVIQPRPSFPPSRRDALLYRQQTPQSPSKSHPSSPQHHQQQQPHHRTGYNPPVIPERSQKPTYKNNSNINNSKKAGHTDTAPSSPSVSYIGIAGGSSNTNSSNNVLSQKKHGNYNTRQELGYPDKVIPNDNRAERRTPSHSDESYVVSPNASYI